MFFLLNLAAATAPAPGNDGGLRPGLDPNQVTPGTLGFLATLFLVVAIIFLIRDMVKRIRRVRYRALAEENAAAENAEGSGAEPDTRPPGTAADDVGPAAALPEAHGSPSAAETAQDSGPPPGGTRAPER